MENIILILFVLFISFTVGAISSIIFGIFYRLTKSKRFKYSSCDDWFQEYIKNHEDLRGYSYPILRDAWNASRLQVK